MGEAGGAARAPSPCPAHGRVGDAGMGAAQVPNPASLADNKEPSRVLSPLQPQRGQEAALGTRLWGQLCSCSTSNIDALSLFLKLGAAQHFSASKSKRASPCPITSLAPHLGTSASHRRCHTSHRQPRQGPHVTPKALAPQPSPPRRLARQKKEPTMCHNSTIVPRSHRALSHPPQGAPRAQPIKGPTVATGVAGGGLGVLPMGGSQSPGILPPGKSICSGHWGPPSRAQTCWGRGDSHHGGGTNHDATGLATRSRVGRGRRRQLREELNEILGISSCGEGVNRSGCFEPAPWPGGWRQV